jgi:hypothetical protein
MRTLLGAAVAALVISSLGCGGGIIKGYTYRAARTKHADANSCPAKQVKTEVVRELPPEPGSDYTAIVRATGCGSSKDYQCTHEEGGATYYCVDAK